MINPSPKTILLLAAGALGLIRGIYSLTKRRGTVTERREGWSELLVLSAALAGFILPIVWASTRWLAFADFPPIRALVWTGALTFAISLYLFHRTHADLGANWSARLQITNTQGLVTSGVYSRIRHPMYLSLLLYGLGQALVVPNWIAGPSCLAGAALLFATRVRPEEAMMRERFGQEYDGYVARTGRLFPRSPRTR